MKFFVSSAFAAELSSCLRTNHLVLSENGKTLHAKFLLVGGKGGFGSRLKAQGSKMSARKTDDFGSCRDLKGNRIRSYDEQQMINDHLKAREEPREIRKEKLMARLSKLSVKMNSSSFKQKHHITIPYEVCDEYERNIENGLAKAVSMNSNRKSFFVDHEHLCENNVTYGKELPE
jgi:hypothetical protein